MEDSADLALAKGESEGAPRLQLAAYLANKMTVQGCKGRIGLQRCLSDLACWRKAARRVKETETLDRFLSL